MERQLRPVCDEPSEADQEQLVILVWPPVGRIERVGGVAEAEPGAHLPDRLCGGRHQTTVDCNGIALTRSGTRPSRPITSRRVNSEMHTTRLAMFFTRFKKASRFARSSTVKKSGYSRCCRL